MSEPTNQELKELILNMEKQILNLDKKLEIQLTEIKSDIKEGFAEVKGEIKRLDERINGLDKRLSNEEIISRSAFITVIGGVAAGLVKLFFFSDSL